MNPQEILLRLVAIQRKFAENEQKLEVALVQILIDGFSEEEKIAAGIASSQPQ